MLHNTEMQWCLQERPKGMQDSPALGFVDLGAAIYNTSLGKTLLPISN